MRFFVDTSIFIDCLRRNVVPSSRHFLESFGGEHIGFTSSITVAELSVGAHLAQREDALKKTLQLLEIVEIIDIDSKIAIDAGKIYASLVKEGKTIELNDCLIAATALSAGMNAIVTRNIKHFDRIPGITAVEPENI
ncbi:type II toxin-antitoxin system VapC family toxin [Methanolobus zinderi]|uniref:Ribonuclease VapC n=1 Tax=Methanolobus zinderi TaxID=536044 RepID=A0A7D5E8Y0_9EURY|nr:type II toxin-antitoxin system VapC family toxin [Methanolobus zinderi]QLC50739.1 type II toxin-antitoxin system VapC family toxin [Methanolobus zinderi]